MGGSGLSFSKVFNTPTSKPYQIQKNKYLENGLLPIIDQGKSLLLGIAIQLKRNIQMSQISILETILDKLNMLI